MREHVFFSSVIDRLYYEYSLAIPYSLKMINFFKNFKPDAYKKFDDEERKSNY